MQDLDNIRTPTECHLLIAFLDISGFTKEFDTATDRELFDRISQLYEELGRNVEGSGGKIIKFMGDGVLLVYPRNDASQAVESLRHLKTNIDAWLHAHSFRGELYVRAHVGSVICGLLGTQADKRFDIVGKAVNTTAMLHCNGFALSPYLETLLRT